MSGGDETTYEVLSAEPIPEAPGTTSAEKERLVETGPEVGAFEVVGWIDAHYIDQDDRPVECSVSSKGFTFRVDGHTLHGRIGEIGTWMRLTIREFTLWTSRWP